MEIKPVSYFLQFAPIDDGYEKVLEKLKRDFEEAIDDVERENIFISFANNYTVIPILWNHIILHFKKQNKDFHSLLKRSFSHFYSSNAYENARKRCRDCYKSLHDEIVFGKSFYHTTKGSIPEEVLTFPNAMLETHYFIYHKASKRPIHRDTLQKYEKALALTNRVVINEENYEPFVYYESVFGPLISRSIEDYEKWMNMLFEWEDKKFGVQTLECELSKNFGDKHFWKAYINVMKVQNFKVMLNIYRRYTRLFLSDIEMKEKYNKEMKKIDKITGFNDLPELEYYLFEKNCERNKRTKCNNHIILDGIVYQQNFDLPETLMFYINFQSSPKIKQKLFKSCKFLFLQNPHPICHQLIIKSRTKNSRFSYQSLKIKDLEKDLNLLSNLHITDNLYITESFENAKILHLILPKLYKCEPRFVDIRQQIITTEEFKFLINPTKIEKFKFWNGAIINFDGSTVSFKDILRQTLNASEIRLV
uniref:Uncharacterized protein n=1 Tax=Panagrolaimus davidi TaxID=227884 RepID=A0A914Q520_9BILA